jgi:hypothetical protein
MAMWCGSSGVKLWRYDFADRVICFSLNPFDNSCLTIAAQVCVSVSFGVQTVCIRCVCVGMFFAWPFERLSGHRCPGLNVSVDEIQRIILLRISQSIFFDDKTPIDNQPHHKA